MKNKQAKSKSHQILAGIVWFVVGLVVASIIVHFAWNMAIPDLFGAAKMSFKNAFGLVLLASMVAVIFGRSLMGRQLHNKKVADDK